MEDLLLFGFFLLSHLFFLPTHLSCGVLHISARFTVPLIPKAPFSLSPIHLSYAWAQTPPVAHLVEYWCVDQSEPGLCTNTRIVFFFSDCSEWTAGRRWGLLNLKNPVEQKLSPGFSTCSCNHIIPMIIYSFLKGCTGFFMRLHSLE